MYGLANSGLSLALHQWRDRMNLFYTLETQALNRSSAGRPFLIFQGQQWTYKEVYDAVLKQGTWLKNKFGITKNEVVAMDFMNGPQFIFIWFGLWSIGAVPAFINYNLNGDPLVHSIRSSGARILLVEEEVYQKFSEQVIQAFSTDTARKEKEAFQTIVFSADVEAEIMSVNAVREPNPIRGGQELSDMAILIYTSGTTGMPKPAVVSWNKAIRSGYLMSSYVGLFKTDRYYTCMPLYHTSAALLGFCASLTSGSIVIIGRHFSTKTFWQDVRQHDATLIQYVGETCRYLLAAPPQIDPSTGENLDKKHKVRLAFGNGLRPDIWKRFKTRFGIETIGEFYGSTEGPIALWNNSSNDWSAGAIGRNGTLLSLILGGQVAIVEVDVSTELPLRDPSNHNFCNNVPRDHPGELLVRIDPSNIKQKFQGYYGNEAATECKILRDVFAKGDAFFRTGDVVRWDKEGRWWFVDRIGDTFRWRSENVSTAEVGEALGTHPAVWEANVYGVQIPHHDGRAGCAALQLDPAAVGEGKRVEVLMEDLAKHVAERLPKYAVPVFLRVVSKMDRTGTNKQTKAVLRDRGVDLGGIEEGDSLWWLKGGVYVPFREKEWKELNSGAVKL